MFTDPEGNSIGLIEPFGGQAAATIPTPAERSI